MVTDQHMLIMVTQLGGDMNDLNFDIYAMVKPKTDDDVLQLLKELESEIAFLGVIVDDIFGVKE